MGCAVQRDKRRLFALVTVFVFSVPGCSAGADRVDSADGAAVISYSQWQEAAVQSVVATVPYDGRVVPSSLVPVFSAASGTVTRSPPMGAALQPGDPVMWVDERPVVALAGDVPMYRDLVAPASGVALVGADVGQLQAFLVAAGYLDGPVDGRFGGRTGTAARDWRADHGMSALSGFTRAELVFIAGAGPWTVTESAVRTGSMFAGGEVMQVSAGIPAVTVSLDSPPPAEAAYAVVSLPGQDVPEIPLTASGSATLGDDGTFSLLLAVAALPAGAQLKVGTAVVVEQREVLATDVVTIPVAAVRLDGAGGTVVVCRDREAGDGEQCAVTLGVSDGTLVEVTSGIDAGTQVAVAP